MIRFVIRRHDQTSAIVGLAIFPADLARLMSGFPEFTNLAEIGLKNAPVEAVQLFFFRDISEFREGLREAGVDPQMIMFEPGEQNGGQDGAQQFAAPPLSKIRGN